MEQVFTVKGMSCGHCERAVTQAVHQLDPQARVQINREQSRVWIDSHLEHQALAQAIAAEGYEVSAA